MAAPPSKRYRERSGDSFSSVDSIGPDGVFPSESSDNETEHCFFPSEDSNQTVTLEIDEPLSDSSLSETQAEMNVGKELTRIGKTLVSPCCDNLCLRHLTAMDVIACQTEINQYKNKTDRKRCLFAKLTNGSSETSKGMITTRYFVAGKEICAAAWCKVYSVSYRTLRRMKQKIILGEEMEHGNLGKKRRNTKTEAAIAWMDRYFNLIGDKMPDKDQIHLPCWENQKDIYHRYCNDFKSRGSMEEDLLGISLFYKVWIDHFSNVIIPEVSKIVVHLLLGS